MVMPASLAITVGVYPPAERGAAVAAWTAATGAAGVIGNLGGGLVMQYLPWRALFGVPVLLAAALAALVAVMVPRVPRHPAALDLAGTVLLTAASVALLTGIIEGPEAGWGSGLVVTAFGVAAVLFAGFVAHQLRASAPLLDPGCSRRRGCAPGRSAWPSPSSGCSRCSSSTPASSRRSRASHRCSPGWPSCRSSSP
ncbi:putative integral membrane protein [[Actinomadura] parvosata subsp. kistnae]|nr:putative integral membrane protein [Actinomadura parvosata subsp. kistnae]